MKKYIALFMAVCLLAVCPCAWADYWNEGHSGTEADPYVIDTNADLEALRDRVNAGTESGDKYYKQTQNLEISSITDWVPIGTEKNTFQGHFDGNNHDIQLNIVDRNNSTSALFGTVETTEGYAVKNLKVGGTIMSRYSGGIVDRLNSGIIDNCSFSGTLETGNRYGEKFLGGIVRYMAGGTVKNSSFSGSINTTGAEGGYGAYGGGIVAYMTAGSIENCTSNANISVTRGEASSCAGGIVGYAQIASSRAIKDCTFSGTVYGKLHAGGIAGYVSGGNLQNNSVTGNANGQAIISSTYASGGIAGRIGDSTVLESCDVASIVTVEISGKTPEGAGGIVGLMNASTVRNNESYATISGDISNMGGVVGKLDAASYTISNNRYSSAEHGIGNNAQGVPSEEGCIRVGPSIAITTDSLPDGVAESPYTATLATDSTSAVVWTLTNGTSLPTGLTLDRTAGTISGTPTKAGDYTFTVKASPATGAPATKDFKLKIQEKGSSTITITTTSLPNGTVNASYNAVLSANTSNVTWSVSSGSLPAGLTLNSSTGAITGTPTAAGTSTFTVRAVSGSNSATKQLSITINSGTTPTPGSITITTTTLPEGVAGMSYSASLASNPSGATWTHTGSLPAGLVLDSSDRISGTPTVSGKFDFTVTATYGTASTVKSLSITISPLEITTSSLPNGRVSESYSQTLRSNGTGLTWTVSSGYLPSGLTLQNSSGLLSGTLTRAGEYTFTVSARNSYAGASKQFTVRVSGGASGISGNDSGGGCNSLPALALILTALFALRKSKR